MASQALSLNDMVRQALVSVCQSSVTYNSHLEILGSVHIRADGNDVTSFLLNEKSYVNQGRHGGPMTTNSIQPPTRWMNYGSPMPNNMGPRGVPFGSEPRRRRRGRGSGLVNSLGSMTNRGRGRGRSLSLSNPVCLDRPQNATQELQGTDSPNDLDNNLNSVLQQITRLAENAAAEREKDQWQGSSAGSLVKDEVIELDDSDENTSIANPNHFGIKKEEPSVKCSVDQNDAYGGHTADTFVPPIPDPDEDTKSTLVIKPEPQAKDDVEILSCSRCLFQCTSKLELQYHLSENCIKVAPTTSSNSAGGSPTKTKGKAKSNAFYLCSTCQKTFASNAMLMAHISAEHNHLRFQCPICKVILRTRDSFNCHMNSQHNKNKVYKCPMCSKYYYTRQNLYQHKVRYHRYQSKANSPAHSSQGADNQDQVMENSY